MRRPKKSIWEILESGRSVCDLGEISEIMCDLGLELAKSRVVSCMDSRGFSGTAFRGKVRSSPAWEFRERRFAASKVEVRLEGSCVHTYLTEIAHSARLIPRSTGSRRRLVPVNEQSRSSSRRVTRLVVAHVLDRNRTLRSAHSSLNRLTPSARGCQRAAREGEPCSAAASHGRI
jgi:hypothetical protein